MYIYFLLVFLVVADEAADDDDNSTGDERVVCPRFDLRNTQSGSNRKYYRPHNQYNRRFFHIFYSSMRKISSSALCM